MGEMKNLLLALCAAACLAAARSSGSPPPESKVIAALVADGYTVAGRTVSNSGYGLLALSNNVTLWSTGKPKKVYYLTGSARDTGYMFGQLSANDTLRMSTEYVNNVVPALVSPGIIKKLGNSTLVEWLLNEVGNFITKEAVKSFKDSNEAGVFPQWVYDEMAGIAAGANSKLRANQQVDPDRIITLNYGFDWISAQVFSGAIIGKLLDAARRDLDAHGVAVLTRHLDERSIQVPTFCDAFMVSKSATASGKGAFMGRDLQLVTGGVFQDLAATVVYHPVTEAGQPERKPLVAVSGPGFVGAITALNSAGFAMGVDTLRAGFIDADRPGLNSILMVRVTSHTAATTEAATQAVRASTRGVPYFYPMQDAAGDGRVLEVGKSSPGTDIPDMRALINDTKLLQVLPSWAEVQAASPVDYADGVFVRNTSYRPPQDLITKYNPGLWGLSGLPYNASAWGPLASTWPSFAEENADWGKTYSRYFSPARVPEDVQDIVLVSNMAIVPQLRVAEMTFWASVFHGEAITWRYDTLARRVVDVARNGGFTLEETQNTILFLDPWQAPGYWKQQEEPGNLNSTVIQGAIAAMDCGEGILRSKTGYFGDGWLQITLPAYL